MGLHDSKLVRRLGLKLRGVPRAEALAAQAVIGLELGHLKEALGYKGLGRWHLHRDQGAGTGKRPTWREWCADQLEANDRSADHWIQLGDAAVAIAKKKRRADLRRLAGTQPSKLKKAERMQLVEGFARLLEGKTLTELVRGERRAKKSAKAMPKGLRDEIRAIVREELKRERRKA